MSTKFNHYEVKFMNPVSNDVEEHFWFPVGANENLYDVLEDVLYIHNELTPINRFWADDLEEHGVTYYSYHNLEYFMVTSLWVDGTQTYFVYELSYDPRPLIGG